MWINKCYFLCMDILLLLNHTDLFGGLSEKSKHLLADIAVPKEIAKGRMLFREGERGFALYLLGTGNIQLGKRTKDAGEVIVKVVRPGEVFGEVILFEQDRYPVTATAIKKSLLFVLPKHQMYCLLDNKSFRNDFFVLLMKKQRYLTERLRDQQSVDVDVRLAGFLKEHYGMKNRIVPGISKKAMASSIGVTPETLSRLLLRLKKQGVLVWEGKEIVVGEKFWGDEK
ncbi:MAG: cyclic nucleotide-binding domain-containing protein [Chitinivibrionales bacterium]|nr:cyclic nucleotide-binding domain-containing protein [Chitinivibrionales bacterium]